MVLFSRGFMSMRSKPAEPPAPAAAAKVETSIAEAESLLFKGIKSIGYSDAEANVMRDAMMWAQLRDNNQGFIKVRAPDALSMKCLRPAAWFA